MAFDIIPKNIQDIGKIHIFQENLNEYVKVYTYFADKQIDPIALSRNSSEYKKIKVSRKLQDSFDLKEVSRKLELKDVNLAFGYGSRGGRGIESRGLKFEKEFTDDLKSWWQGEDKYSSETNKSLVMDLVSKYNWDKKSLSSFKIINEGGKNKPRSLIFNGSQVFIGTAGDPNIGKTITDVTVEVDRKPIYFSLKFGSTVTFFNSGVMKVLKEVEIKKGRITNRDGLTLLKLLGLNQSKFCDVFNTYVTGAKMKRFSEDVTNKINKHNLVRLLLSGIGYGYHYVHSVKNEVKHFELTKSLATKLAKPSTVVAYYGGKKLAGKRIDIVVETPMISLKFNIRNKQGGVYPSHIMCDYIFKRYE